MTSRYEVWIGSTKLSSLNENLLILDVAYSPVEKEDKQYTTANLDGYDISKTYVSKQRVTVTFELHIYDIVKRNEACQKVNEWADSNTMLRINDRSGQCLIVHCEEHAVIGSVRDWTKPLTIVFETDYIPYWQTYTADVLTLTGKNGNLKVSGNTGKALVSVEVTAKTEIKAITIGVGTSGTTNYTSIILKDISVPKNKKLTVTYTHNRYLRVAVDGKSVMTKLQKDSTDLLLAPCGQTTPVYVSAGSNATTKFTVRGLWK